MERFKKFKKELKKIDTKTLLKEYKEYVSGVKENQKTYVLYYHDLILCTYEPRKQIFSLIDKYEYEIRYNGTVDGAVRKSKELNCKVLLIVNLE